MDEYQSKYWRIHGRLESLEKDLQTIHAALLSATHGNLRLTLSEEKYMCGHVPPNGKGYFWACGTVLRCIGPLLQGDYVVAFDLNGREHYLVWDQMVQRVEVSMETLVSDLPKS